MKKLITILLLVIYAAGITGVGVTEFYCCGELQSVTASLHEEPNKKAVDGDGCCKTRYQFHKIKDTHQHASVLPFAFGHEVTLPAVIHFTHLLPSAEGRLFVANRAKAPPPLERLPRYILLCTYRI